MFSAEDYNKVAAVLPGIASLTAVCPVSKDFAVKYPGICSLASCVMVKEAGRANLGTQLLFNKNPQKFISNYVMPHLKKTHANASQGELDKYVNQLFFTPQSNPAVALKDLISRSPQNVIPGKGKHRSIFDVRPTFDAEKGYTPFWAKPLETIAARHPHQMKLHASGRTVPLDELPYDPIKHLYRGIDRSAAQFTDIHDNAKKITHNLRPNDGVLFTTPTPAVAKQYAEKPGEIIARMSAEKADAVARLPVKRNGKRHNMISYTGHESNVPTANSNFSRWSNNITKKIVEQYPEQLGVPPTLIQRIRAYLAKKFGKNSLDEKHPSSRMFYEGVLNSINNQELTGLWRVTDDLGRRPFRHQFMDPYLGRTRRQNNPLLEEITSSTVTPNIDYLPLLNQLMRQGRVKPEHYDALKKFVAKMQKTELSLD